MSENLPPGPRTRSQELAAAVTLPAPDAGAAPSDPASELGAVLSASVAPRAEWVAALEAKANELRARASQENLEQDARTGLALAERDREIAAHDDRINRIETSSASAASSSAQVEKFLSGFLPPKAVGFILGFIGLVQVAFSVYQTFRGGK